MKTVHCMITSDVSKFEVNRVADHGREVVTVAVFDDEAYNMPLTTAGLLPSDAIALARALLLAAGWDGKREGNAVRYTFID